MAEEKILRDLQIGEAAEEFGVTVASLRDWDKHGLITTYRGSRNARVIPVSEFEKVKRVKEILSIPGKTFEDVRNELYKDQLVRYDQKEKEKNEVVSAFANMFDESQGMKTMVQLMEAMHQEMQKMNSRIQELESGQKKLMDPSSENLEKEVKDLEQQLLQERKRNEERERELQQLRQKMQDRAVQEQEKKSWFSRLFG